MFTNKGLIPKKDWFNETFVENENFFCSNYN